MSETFVPTSVARRMISRMQLTHERRRISIFSGPPGIGKTTAIDAFRALHPRQVVIVKVARKSAREVMVLQHAVEALRRLCGKPGLAGPRTLWVLRSYLYNAACEWAGVEPGAVQRGEVSTGDVGPLTLVFDEAQNLSREALDVMRFWNDRDRCYAPFPIGLVFVGNNEFSLSPDADGQSPISAAVADRALHIQSLAYDDVVDADIDLFLQSQGVTDGSARAAILRYLRTSRSPRSFRRVADLIGEVMDLADGQLLTGAVVNQVLAPA